jgi:hypothetical protein
MERNHKLLNFAFAAAIGLSMIACGRAQQKKVNQSTVNSRTNAAANIAGNTPANPANPTARTTTQLEGYWSGPCDATAQRTSYAFYGNTYVKWVDGCINDDPNDDYLTPAPVESGSFTLEGPVGSSPGMQSMGNNLNGIRFFSGQTGYAGASWGGSMGVYLITNDPDLGPQLQLGTPSPLMRPANVNPDVFTLSPCMA